MEYKKYLQERILKLRIISALVHSKMAMSLIFSPCLNQQTFFFITPRQALHAIVLKVKFANVPTSETRKAKKIIQIH